MSNASARTLEVVALQLDLVWENPAANYDAARRLLESAQPAPGALVVLPETFATGFSANESVTAEPPDGPTASFFAAVAREFGVTVLGGAVIRDNKGVTHNRALVFGPDGAPVASYAKMRPFRPRGIGEPYTPGVEPALFTLGKTTIAPFVCYDLRFPELFRGAAARWRPEVFVVIASWPEARIRHWDRLLAARAIENQAYVVGVNRTGVDPFLNHVGHTQIVNFHGDVLVDAGSAVATISATLDLDALAVYREERPFLEDIHGVPPPRQS